jgi:hypothetical protein
MAVTNSSTRAKHRSHCSEPTSTLPLSCVGISLSFFRVAVVGFDFDGAHRIDA